jgi:oxygen-independent coproporphyrinogen-3 oxidase
METPGFSPESFIGRSMISSLYIHIPFCRRKCLYCDFYSMPGHPAPLARDYVNALICRIEPLAQRFSTVYMGGGTPTVLENELLKRLLGALGKNLARGAEFTVEANPESLDRRKLGMFADFGVNRLSVGIQSLDDRKLKKLGRIHDAARGVESIKMAAAAGFGNVSADLIFGVPGESLEDWRSELEEAARLPLTHVSAYSLTYEKGTPLFTAVKNRSIVPLEDEVVAGMYEASIDILALRGFKQYEVSNFAREGFGCRHNLSYWENNPYIGLGASAVSYSDGVRTKNVSDVAEYIRRHREGRPAGESSEKLSPPRRARETAAVKIRTKDGIDFAWFRDKTGYDFMDLEGKAVSPLIEEGLLKFRKDGATPTGIALKRKGFLFCDTVSSALL